MCGIPLFTKAIIKMMMMLLILIIINPYCSEHRTMSEKIRLLKYIYFLNSRGTRNIRSDAITRALI